MPIDLNSKIMSLSKIDPEEDFTNYINILDTIVIELPTIDKIKIKKLSEKLLPQMPKILTLLVNVSDSEVKFTILTLLERLSPEVIQNDLLIVIFKTLDQLNADTSENTIAMSNSIHNLSDKLKTEYNLRQKTD